MCKQHHRTVLNPFLNGTENDDFEGMAKHRRGENVRMFGKNKQPLYYKFVVAQ